MSKEIHYFHMGQWPIFVGFTDSVKALRKEIKRLRIENFEPLKGSAATYTFEEPEGLVILIYVQDFKKSKQPKHIYAALVAHEATHALQQTSHYLAQGKSLGVEADAYFVQYVTQECLQIAWGNKKSRATKP